MNAICCATSGCIQCGGRNGVPENRRDLAIGAPKKNKENTMLRTFAAALIATTLVAGTAFAADSGIAGSATTQAAPAASTTSVKADQTAKSAKSAKSVKHVRENTRKHVTRVKSGKMHQAHHVKGRKVHQANGPASKHS
jgi:hypothetical protein